MTYYHYTSIAALLCIINSEKVWFTDHRFLNDRHEIKHGLEKLLSYFPNEKESFIKAFELHNIQTSYCILSLSKSAEVLTQWREYADALSLFFKMIRIDTHVGVSVSVLRTQLNQMETLLPKSTSF